MLIANLTGLDAVHTVPLQVALKYVEKFGVDKVRLLKFERNRGKGGAVRMVGHMQVTCRSHVGRMAVTCRSHASHM